MLGIVWDDLDGPAGKLWKVGTSVRLDWFGRLGVRVAIGFGVSPKDRRQVVVHAKDEPLCLVSRVPEVVHFFVNCDYF